MISVKRIFSLLNLLLLAGIVYYSVEIFYKTIESKLEHTQVTGNIDTPEPTKNQPSASPYSHYKPIINRDLFNTVKKVEQKSEPIDVEALKPTELNLKLWGTVANKDGNSAFAVIEELKTKKQNLYRAGDAIQNATIKAILREKVILRVNGKDEILAMADIYSGKTPDKSPRGRVPVQNDITLQRSFVDDAVKNIGSLLGQVRIRPHFENGKPSGLSMTGIKSNSIFRKMGLKNGDVLTGIEGKKIQSVNDVIGLYEKLKSSSSVNLDIKRRNRQQTLTFRIQ